MLGSQAWGINPPKPLELFSSFAQVLVFRDHFNDTW